MTTPAPNEEPPMPESEYLDVDEVYVVYDGRNYRFYGGSGKFVHPNAVRVRTGGIPWLPGGASGAAMPEFKIREPVLATYVGGSFDTYYLVMYQGHDHFKGYVGGDLHFRWQDIAYFARINAPQGGTVGGSDA